MQKGLNATSGDQFTALPLVESDPRSALAVDSVARGVDSHMKQTGMLVGNLEFNP